MILSAPSPAYDRNNEAQARREITTEDARNIKRDTDVIFSGDDSNSGPKLILKDVDGGLWRLVVDVSGTLTTTAA